MGTHGGVVESTSYTNIRNLSRSLDHPKLVVELDFDTGHRAFIDSLMLSPIIGTLFVIGVNL